MVRTTCFGSCLTGDCDGCLFGTVKNVAITRHLDITAPDRRCEDASERQL